MSAPAFPSLAAPPSLWLNPAWGLATRATISLGVPLLLASTGTLPLHVTFVTIAAHGLSLLDIKGPYALRFAFLLSLVGLMTGACALGVATRDHTSLAILAAGLFALNAGLWRQLTPDYGLYLSIPVGLQFFMALLMSEERLYEHGHNPVLSAFIGALWGSVVHIALWPIRPEHPLRRAVADSWSKAGDLLSALAKNEDPRSLEGEFRTVHDKSQATLTAAAIRRPLRPGLQELYLLSARLITRVSALAAVIEAFPSGQQRDVLDQAFRATMESLAQTNEAVALVTISGQPAHLAIASVRLKRADALLEALVLASNGDEAIAHVAGLLTTELRAIQPPLTALTSRANERSVIPLELFDLRTWKYHPLASFINLRQRVDPLILRFTARLSLMLITGTAFVLYLKHRGINVPHPYWLPFTMIIVAQTDYGATRQRAVQRLAGTLGGSLAASALLFLPLSKAFLYFLTFLTCFAAGYSLKRKYAVSTLFITLMVVLLTETSHVVPVYELTLERIALTTLGGLTALLATLLFWPSWERDRHTQFVNSALTATHTYLQAIQTRLTEGGDYTPAEITAKQQAERASATALSSLGRLYAEPRNPRESLERAAVIVNGNARLIRIFNHLLVSANTTPSLTHPATQSFIQALLSDLNALATQTPIPSTSDTLSPINLPPGSADHRLLPLLRQARTELNAILASHNAVTPLPTPLPSK